MVAGSHSQTLELCCSYGPRAPLSLMISAVWFSAGLKIRFDESKVLQFDMNSHPEPEGTVGGQGARGETFCRQTALTDVTLKIVLLNLATGEGAVLSTFKALTPYN